MAGSVVRGLLASKISNYIQAEEITDLEVDLDRVGAMTFRRWQKAH